MSVGKTLRGVRALNYRGAGLLEKEVQLEADIGTIWSSRMKRGRSVEMWGEKSESGGSKKA